VSPAHPGRGAGLLCLSPHLDDAVLSCGGQLHRRAAAGESVLVVTVFSGDEGEAPSSRAAARLESAWGLATGVIAARRAEDEAACRALGVGWRHLPFLDALYRRHPETGRALYPSIRSLFRGPREEDTWLVGRIAAALAELPAAAEVLAPLGVGGHADHLLTRQAAAAAWGGRCAFYEEFPYGERRAAVRRAVGRGLAPEVVLLGEADIAARCRAVAAYRSQVPPLFGDREGLERRIRRQVAALGGERVWRHEAVAHQPRGGVR
jgi:LmbE family N-acetylglucosaminyl deacetylase